MQLRRGASCGRRASQKPALPWPEALAARGMACVPGRRASLPGPPGTGELLAAPGIRPTSCARRRTTTLTAPDVLFEVGAAHMLRKPIILFTTTYDQLFGGLCRGIYVVKATIDDLPSLSSRGSTDAFEHAKPLSAARRSRRKPRAEAEPSPGREQELAALRRDEPRTEALAPSLEVCVSSGSLPRSFAGRAQRVAEGTDLRQNSC